MNIPAGLVFKLKDQIEWKQNEVNSKTFFKNEHGLVMLFAIDTDCELPEHTAPGQALVMALEGKALFIYDGKESILSKGESMILAPKVLHQVKALEPYKMAVLISLD